MPHEKIPPPPDTGQVANRNGIVIRIVRSLRARFGRRPVRWGSLRRTVPVSSVFGLDRGTPVDRFYIERFLAANGASIAGRVLEIGDATYTGAFGGDRVTSSDVLHAVEGNPEATLVGSLETGEGVPEASFDCIILTQTLHVIYDVRSALATTARALRPGGVLLATVPGISQVSRYDMDRWGDYWRFTSAAVTRLFGESFDPEAVEISVYGNVLAATAFLQGVAAEELSAGELEHLDPDFEVLIGIAARAGEG